MTWLEKIKLAGQILHEVGGALPEIVRATWRIKMVTLNAEEYVVEGQAKDHEWLIANRDLLEYSTVDEMYKNGWVPFLDNSPELTYDFNAENERFDFQLKIKGVKVGVEKANKITGILLSQGLVVRRDGTVTMINADL